MPASIALAPTPLSRTRTLAGLALLSLWLGWTLPALWAQARVGDTDNAAGWTADQVLAQLPPGIRADSAEHPLLLRASSSPCGCARSAALPAGLHVQASPSALPFDWLVLHQRRLVYAGPAVLERSCGGPLTAAALVTHLLQSTQAPVVLSNRCPCHQE